ncbi:glutamine synthetase, variant 2 [Coprinopsis cinerea AmutBmut pab1-1]|nr:glutamine synthetase, variant 2 [Coprinopsis cinerea AmutBmut pab1-1]
MSKEKFLGAASSDGFGFCSVVFGWDMHDTVYSRELLISTKANGYRDIIASIDISTFRRIPWENNVPFFLLSFNDPDTKKPLPVDPRGTLQKTMDQAENMGFVPYAGVEYEYFNFKETPESAFDKKFHGLQPLTPGSKCTSDCYPHILLNQYPQVHGYSLLRTQLNNKYFHELFDQSLAFDVDIEGHHTETGPGVLETALAYTSALRMADNAVLFKYLAKSVGMMNGIIPSFMAKPWANLPGCSGHIHVSMRDAEGKRNLFAVSDEELKTGRTGAANEDTRFISQEAEWFLAGILDGLADIMPTLVPNINGYKRLVVGDAYWAPNAVTYGYDSRAASVRIISPPSCPPAATRFEIRVPGADMNAYFALSAIFRLGLRGIEKKLPLTILPISKHEPEDRVNGKIQMLPLSLEAATARMMRPESIAREIFGDEFVNHYGGTREHEVRLWNEAVTNWEVERYLELA